MSHDRADDELLRMLTKIAALLHKHGLACYLGMRSPERAAILREARADLPDGVDLVTHAYSIIVTINEDLWMDPFRNALEEAPDYRPEVTS